ncbi:hypothetical protein ATO12_03950 [Aquimarina atlantica]|uniref:Uncharacterized protein n=1 Tax=Aquimarina atlantica TaxID=1317122 RepID=A0A023C161_9FLAO|nr:hypothetical protein [Aquimarina atlantica]EZH75954.1 hypothetical protein ATO12_03950 [Aquimarina atlantica]
MKKKSLNTKKLTIEKFKISKLNSLNTISGGYGTASAAINGRCPSEESCRQSCKTSQINYTIARF